MIKNAFAYVTRKSLKSIIILLVITAMSTLCLISLSIKDATNRASKETFGNITNSFSMEINRRVNFGTPRGGGNIKGQDIKKIAESKDIDSYVKRINSVADLVDKDITEEDLAKTILKIKDMPKDRYDKMRYNSRKVWEEKFDLSNNYSDFVEHL